jgi:transposase
MERKVKYGYTFKLECVQEVLNEHQSCCSVSKQKGFSKSQLQKWVRLYNNYGGKGLLPSKNRIYSIDFKMKVLKSLSQEHLSLSKACLLFNIPSESTIVKWKKDFANFGIEGLKPKLKGRPISMSDYKRKKRKSDKPLTTEEELLKENERLRCENELLKKLQALIQARRNPKP